MDTRTGMIIFHERFEDAIPDEQKKHFVRVVRDLSLKEKAESQIALYAPCVCGSGKKFKFCCRKP